MLHQVLQEWGLLMNSQIPHPLTSKMYWTIWMQQSAQDLLNGHKPVDLFMLPTIPMMWFLEEQLLLMELSILTKVPQISI